MFINRKATNSNSWLKGKAMKSQNNFGLKTGRRHFHPGGFTLVEILIVVIILGILAAIIIPNVSSASTQTRENMIKENLRMFRQQIGAYRAEHDDVSPGYPNNDPSETPTEAVFIQQMTQTTDKYGNSPGSYGPYMRKVPENTVNNLTSIQILANGEDLPAEGGNTHGWIYSPEKIAVLAGNSGADSSGVLYSKY